MFAVALCIMGKTWKHPKCLLMDEWTACYIHTHTCAIYICVYVYIHIFNKIIFSHKKKEIFSFAAKRVKLEGIMLSKTSQSKRNTV